MGPKMSQIDKKVSEKAKEIFTVVKNAHNVKKKNCSSLKTIKEQKKSPQQLEYGPKNLQIPRYALILKNNHKTPSVSIPAKNQQKICFVISHAFEAH